jgi:ATP synthase F1 complex assembly factor 2
MAMRFYRRNCYDVNLLSIRLRSLSTSAKINQNALKDTRLAGRRRFYKQVGIVSVKPPWTVTIGTANTKVDLLDSPISAGVDGSPSASGVTNIQSSSDSRKSHLATNNSTNDESDWFGVTLDGKVISTPLGQPLAVPSEHLAWMIAAEWDAQEIHLTPAQMPLMTLTCTALDQTANAMHVYQQQALSYLPTDTLCFWVDPMEERVLYRKQQAAWEQIHSICETVLGNKPAMLLGESHLWLSRKLQHPPEVVQKATTLVQSLNAWELTALSSISSNCKSLLVGLAMLHGNISPTQASAASRVEEEFNIDNWGLVEGGHDYDRLNSSIQLHAAEILIQTTRLEGVASK